MACAQVDQSRRSSMMLVAEEITTATSKFPGRCITDYTNNELLVRILLMVPNDGTGGSLTVIASLKPGYPNTAPEFLINSPTFPQSKKKDLKRLLELESTALLGQPMLCVLLQRCDDFCAAKGTSDGGSGVGHDSVWQTSDTCQIAHKDDFDLATGCLPYTGSGKTKSSKVNRKKARRRRRNDSEESEDDSMTLGLVEEKGSSENPTGGILEATTLIQRDESGTLLTMPTHFMAIRFTDESILHSLSEVQQCLVEKEPLLAKGVFKLESLHMTVCNLGLDTSTQIAHCVETLDRIRPELIENWPKLPLTVHSMSQFYNRAIYAKVKCEADFNDFRNLLRKRLLECGVEVRDEHEGFTPHVTIVKVKRPERRMFGSRNIRPSIYAHVLDQTFGKEKVTALHLCTMGGERRDDGFYVTEYELHA